MKLSLPAVLLHICFHYCRRLAPALASFWPKWHLAGSQTVIIAHNIYAVVASDPHSATRDPSATLKSPLVECLKIPCKSRRASAKDSVLRLSRSSGHILSLSLFHSLVVHSTATWLTSGVAFYDKLKQIATRTHTHTHIPAHTETGRRVQAGLGLSENCAQLFMKA